LQLGSRLRLGHILNLGTDGIHKPTGERGLLGISELGDDGLSRLGVLELGDERGLLSSEFLNLVCVRRHSQATYDVGRGLQAKGRWVNIGLNLGLLLPLSLPLLHIIHRIQHSVRTTQIKENVCAIEIEQLVFTIAKYLRVVLPSYTCDNSREKG